MSSAPTTGKIRGTLPSSRTLTDDSNPESLTRRQKAQLYNLGYKKADVEEMSPERATKIIETKAYKPGSQAYLKNALNPLNGTKGVERLVDRFSDEAIEARNAERLLATPGLEVTRDEFTGACLKAGEEKYLVKDDYTGGYTKGADRFSAILLEYADKNPGKRFRFIDPTLPPLAAGPEWQPIYVNDKRVEVAGLYLAWMPEKVYDEGVRKPNHERLAGMDSRIDRNPEDKDLALKADEQPLVPIPSAMRGPDGQVHQVGQVG